MTSSVMPSASLLSAGSPDRLSKGSTATRGRCYGRVTTAGPQPPSPDDPHQQDHKCGESCNSARHWLQRAAKRFLGPIQPHSVCPHRARDVLDLLLAREVEWYVEFSLKLVEGGSRHQHTARLAQIFKASCNIYAFPVDVVID